MEEYFVAILTMFVVLSLIPLYLWRRRVHSRLSHQHEVEPQSVQGEKVIRAGGNTRRMRRRPAASAASTSSAMATVEGLFFFLFLTLYLRFKW